jgi:glycosyltransferase involved in cell wall biosynthesis
MLKNGDAPLKVLVKAPYSRYSGYGSDGIDMTLALARKGLNVFMQPTFVQPPLPQACANLLTKHLEAPFDLVIIHVDPDALEASEEQKTACDVIIGWSMWEFSALSNAEGKDTFTERLEHFDALLGYSDTSVDSFTPYLPKHVRIGELQGGFEPKLWPFMQRDWDSPRFSFIMNGQLSERKCPWTAIQAFQELKDEYPEEFEPAEFHIHSTTAYVPPIIGECIPKLRVHYETFDQEEMLEFYRSGHVLLAPSRGEGKNLPALEMLSTGGSVIYSDISGHKSWGSPVYAYPLECKKVPIDAVRIGPDCLWGAPNKDHLKELMLHCFRNRDEVKEKGELGAKLIPGLRSWDSVIDSFFNQLPELVPGKGAEIKAKYDVETREALLRRDRRGRA